MADNSSPPDQLALSALKWSSSNSPRQLHYPTNTSKNHEKCTVITMNSHSFTHNPARLDHLDQVLLSEDWGQYLPNFSPLENVSTGVQNAPVSSLRYTTLSENKYSYAAHMAGAPLASGPPPSSLPQMNQQFWPHTRQAPMGPPLRSPEANSPRSKHVTSVIMSQSECCSSCSGTPCVEPNCGPCDAEDCSMEETRVIPCNRESCEQPACSDPCLNTGIQGQKLFTDYGIVQAGKLTSWLDTPWNPQMPRCTTESVQGSLHEVVDPALQLLALSESALPTSPSTGDNYTAGYSQQGAPSAIQAQDISGLQPHHNHPMNNLFGTGALFDPSAQESTKNFFCGANNDTTDMMVQCAWDGCGQQVGYQDWFPHLHYNHIDPQMTFGCPITAETCSGKIGQNPVDHLQNDHGMTFDMNGGGFSCPAPNCLPSETYLDPAMLHRHFDYAHAVPAWGSLRCRLSTCDTSFQNPNEFFSHITTSHTLPAPSMNADDIDLNAPHQATQTLSVPIAKSERSVCRTPVTPQAKDEPAEEEVAHRCQWLLEGKLCAAEFDSEGSLQTHVKEHLQSMSKSTGYICCWEGCERDKLGDKAGFSQRGKLERHMHSHTNYKDSRCDWPGCGQMFSAPQSLRQHYRRHTGEKPWKCDEPGCGKTFTQQSSLTCHMRKHTKNKPLVCQICGKVFSESTNLSKHRSKVHGEIGKHACKWPGCEKTFHRISQLRTHAKEHRRKLSISKPGVAMSESGSVLTGSE